MKIRANGIVMNYELSGAEDKPALLLGHSLAATVDMWRPQMPLLEQKFHVLRYDLRGHGGTEATSGAYTLDMLADDAEALLGALSITSCHYVGLSLGGMIGQLLALRRTPAIKSIALCATSSRMPPQVGPVWRERIATAESKGMAALVDGTIDRWFSKQFQEQHPADVDPVREMIRNTPVAGYAGCCEAIRTLDLTDRLSTIRLPTLIIVGRDDPGTPLAASEEIHRRIAGSTLVVLDAMHFCNIEQAARFNDALGSFLDKVSAE
jgi:3-oxoadipate enol-lactonase